MNDRKKSDYHNALTIFTNTVTLGRCRFSPLSVLLKNKKKTMLSAVVACRIKTNEKQSFLYLRSLVRLSLQFFLRSVKTAHVFLLAFSC